MLNYPKQGTLIAPRSLHLSIYHQILEEHGPQIGLEVLSLSAYIQRFFKKTEPEKIDLYFQARHACESLPTTNVFYTSRLSFDFIDSLVRFVRYAKSYDLNWDKLPESTQKEKDLKAVLQNLKDLPVKENEIPTILKKGLDPKDVYILAYEYNETERLWIDVLLKSGAKLLSGEPSLDRSYFSVANTRKQAQAVAKEIIEKDLNAQDVYVSCPDISSEQFMAQLFDMHKIPYTLLNTNRYDLYTQGFLACLKWILYKDEDSFQDMLKILYPELSQTILHTLAQFPALLQEQKDPLPQIYEENEIIDQRKFQAWKDGVEKTRTWLQEHETLLNLNVQSLETILEILQKCLPCDTSTCQGAYAIQNVLKACKDKLRSKEDLVFLRLFLEQEGNTLQPDSYTGVLIGPRNAISAVHSTVFLCGADAKNFPGLDMHTGIFNEAYLAKLEVPKLSLRLQKQREQLMDILFQIPHLTIFVPESDYEGKDLFFSHELEQWFQHGPKFYEVQETSTFRKPTFSLDKELAHQLFFQEDTFSGSISRLETFANCPLQHFLKYGLSLKEKQDLFESRVRGSIYHHILEKLIHDKKKSYPLVDKEELKQRIEDEFSFICKTMPSQSLRYQTLALETYDKMAKILTFLDTFEKQWRMKTTHQELKVEMIFQWKEMKIQLKAYIDRVDTSKTSFVIFDYKTGQRKLDLKEFYAGHALQLITYTILYATQYGSLPAGCFYISLKTSLQSCDAVDVNRRKKIPVISEIDLREKSEENLTQRQFSGIQFQDLSIYCDDMKWLKIPSKKEPVSSYDQIVEEWRTVLFDLLEEIASGNIQANHLKGGCMYCPYDSICRNGANEIEIPDRVHKEEEYHAI